MTKLSPEARDLIEEARSAERPGSGARARVRARVLARAGAGVAAGATAALVAAEAKGATGLVGGASASTAAGAAGAGVKAAVSTGLVLKWIAVIGVTGTVALGAGIARDRMRSDAVAPVAPSAGITAGAAPAPAVTTGEKPGSREPISDPPAAVPAIATGAPAPRASAPPAISAPPSPTFSAGALHHTPPAAAASGSADSPLEAETGLLDRAQADLRAGRPGRALQALDEHDADFKDGVLHEERLAARILALCGLGRTDEARAEGQRFLARFPRSPVAERVRTSCAGASSP